MLTGHSIKEHANSFIYMNVSFGVIFWRNK